MEEYVLSNIEITLVIMDDFIYACKSKLGDNACCLMYEYVLSSIDILIDYHVWFYVLVSHKVVYNIRYIILGWKKKVTR